MFDHRLVNQPKNAALRFAKIKRLSVLLFEGLNFFGEKETKLSRASLPASVLILRDDADLGNLFGFVFLLDLRRSFCYWGTVIGAMAKKHIGFLCCQFYVDFVSIYKETVVLFICTVKLVQAKIRENLVNFTCLPHALSPTCVLPAVYDVFLQLQVFALF